MESRPLKILIAEDDILLSIGIESIIKKLGHEILEKCSTGSELIEKAVQLNPDLIIVDILLNDLISGIDAVKQILAKLPDISIIYITAESDPRLETKARQETDYLDYFVKPIELDRLERAINKSCISR